MYNIGHASVIVKPCKFALCCVNLASVKQIYLHDFRQLCKIV
jgi:hypothetical protein